MVGGVWHSSLHYHNKHYLDSRGGVVLERLGLSILQEDFEYVRHERNH